MQYPLELTFKLLALAQEVRVTDGRGAVVAYVKQKAFRLKEDIAVYADDAQARLLYTIKADRVIDFSANYHFADASGMPIGSIKRNGVKSLWSAGYTISDADGRTIFTVTEANPWVKVADALLSEIPVLGLFTGYLFHPAYHLASTAGAVSLTMQKQPSFVGRRFVVRENRDVPFDDEVRALLGILLVVLLERNRG